MIFNKKSEIDPDNIPEHIAIIMDGNGRWAKKGLSRSVGHRKVPGPLENCGRMLSAGVRYLTVYAFLPKTGPGLKKKWMS